jgi:long-chain fatty acid transport protein
MRRMTRTLPLIMALAALLAPAVSRATNGYFEHGYGTDSKAIAGAGVALPLGSLSAATNPAAMAFVGERFDAALALFNPNRDYTVTGAPLGGFGLAPGKVKSDSRYFPVPSLGYNHPLDKMQSLGLSLYGNGGMNTNYPASTFYGSSPTGVDLMQLFVALTYARKLDEKNAIGLTPVLAFQRFKATGLAQFAPFSATPTDLTDNGYATSLGGGVRVGYLGRWLPQLAFGASYQSRTWMGPLDRYQGLFAEQGDFDIPSSWVAGVVVTPDPKVDFAVDVQQVRYSEVKSVGTPMLPNLVQAALGQDGGAGFGWKDMTTVKLGVQFRAEHGWTFRGGYSYGQQPIPESEVLLNILAPGVIQQHATVGFSNKLSSGRDVHFALTRAFSNEVTGTNVFEASGQQKITLRMDQWDVEVGFGFGH